MANTFRDDSLNFSCIFKYMQANLLFIYVLNLSIFYFNAQLNHIFNKYDIVYQIPRYSRHKRSVYQIHDSISIDLPFKNKTLSLNLYKNSKILSSEFFKDSTFTRYNILPVRGSVNGLVNSTVSGILVNNRFRGNIFLNGSLDLSSPSTLFVEPVFGFLNSTNGNAFVVYPGNGIKESNSNSSCSSEILPVIVERQKRSLYSYVQAAFQKSDKNGFEDSKNRVCNLFLQTDTYLWDYVMSLRHINRNPDLAYQEIQSILILHVESIQLIYSNAIFQTFSGRIKYHGINFRVDRMQINTTDVDCRIRKNFDEKILRGSFAENNPFCSPNIDVTNFLNLNSYMVHDDFCLSYIFTYRDFAGGTLGLAWVAQAGAIGGICEKNRPMKEAGQTKMLNKSLNTGVVTLMNYGSRVALKVSQLTFAHEVGHNFGAKHDDDHKEDQPRCLPQSNHPDGNYLMFASATSGDKMNNNKFSDCSLDSIAKLVNDVIKGPNNCLIKSDGPFCGNRLTEEDEQCDCGFTEAECNDKCCHPNDAGYGSSCRLKDFYLDESKSRKKIQCSPNAGECCTSDCEFRTEQHMCRPESECHGSSFCSGSSVKCPPSKPNPDNTPCQNMTKVCKSGQCLGSICEHINGWEECTIENSSIMNSQEFAERLCYVACQRWETTTNRDGKKIKRPLTNCISTYDLEKNNEIYLRHKELSKFLIRNGKGIQLAPGQPCDNHRGYCDVFRQCRPIVAQGPLARLRSLIFDVMMWNKVKNFITVYWWGMLLMSLFFIMVMVLFVKVFGYSHPAASLPLNRIISLGLVDNSPRPCTEMSKKRKQLKSQKESLSDDSNYITARSTDNTVNTIGLIGKLTVVEPKNESLLRKLKRLASLRRKNQVKCDSDTNTATPTKTLTVQRIYRPKRFKFDIQDRARRLTHGLHFSIPRLDSETLRRLSYERNLRKQQFENSLSIPLVLIPNEGKSIEKSNSFSNSSTSLGHLDRHNPHLKLISSPMMNLNENFDPSTYESLKYLDPNPITDFEYNLDFTENQPSISLGRPPLIREASDASDFVYERSMRSQESSKKKTLGLVLIQESDVQFQDYDNRRINILPPKKREKRQKRV